MKNSHERRRKLSKTISNFTKIQQKLFKFTILSDLLSTLFFISPVWLSLKQLPTVYLFSFFWHIKRNIKFIKTKSCVFFSGGAAASVAFRSNNKQWNNNNKFNLQENLKRLQFFLLGEWVRERESFLHTFCLLLLLKCLLTTLEQQITLCCSKKHLHNWNISL